MWNYLQIGKTKIFCQIFYLRKLICSEFLFNKILFHTHAHLDSTNLASRFLQKIENMTLEGWDGDKSVVGEVGHWEADQNEILYIHVWHSQRINSHKNVKLPLHCFWSYSYWKFWVHLWSRSRYVWHTLNDWEYFPMLHSSWFKLSSVDLL